MRRPALLAWALAASAAGITLGLHLREAGAPPISGQTTRPPVAEPPSIVPLDVVVDGPQQRKPGTTAQDERAAERHANDRGSASRKPRVDEATMRERARKSASDDIRIAYTLLFEDLDLSEQQEKDLSNLLVEMELERTWTGYQRGKTIASEERHERIAAVIGEQKLDELLMLEVNRQAYWETYQIAALLQRRGVPTNKVQRDGVFDIVVEVRDRYPYTEPSLDHRADEYIDQRLRQLDDFDRHVVELAPSVLSATQVGYLFQAYDRMSRERIDDVERQKKMKAGGTGIDGWMTPGRWSWRSVQP
jgi:hypothetical protein